jgi:hypothetical protein
MRFWEDESLNYYDYYISLSKTNDYANLVSFIPTLCKEYPQLTKYLATTIDSCLGIHRVYLIRTNKGIKLGYTKNTIKERFSESRYKGSEQFEILEILREEEFPALGAVQFEEKLKSLFTQYSIKTDMVMPGKGEFYDTEYMMDILEKYDMYKSHYFEIIGLKSPN